MDFNVNDLHLFIIANVSALGLPSFLGRYYNYYQCLGYPGKCLWLQGWNTLWGVRVFQSAWLAIASMDWWTDLSPDLKINQCTRIMHADKKNSRSDQTFVIIRELFYTLLGPSLSQMLSNNVWMTEIGQSAFVLRECKEQVGQSDTYKLVLLQALLLTSVCLELGAEICSNGRQTITTRWFNYDDDNDDSKDQ